MKQFETRIGLIVNYTLYNLEKTLLKIKKIKMHLKKLRKSSSQISIEGSRRNSKANEDLRRSNFKKTSITSDNLFTEERLDNNFTASPSPRPSPSPRADPAQINEMEGQLASMESLILTSDFHKVLLIYSIEAVYFILNIQSVSWEKVAQMLSVSHVQIWFLNFSFIEFETYVPSPLKKHFMQLENYLISHLVWKGPSSIYKWYKKYELMASNRSLYSSPKAESPGHEPAEGGQFAGDNSPYIQGQSLLPLSNQPEIKVQEIQTLDHLSHRLLHFIMLEINQIGEALKLPGSVQECVWELMKHIFLKVA